MFTKEDIQFMQDNNIDLKEIELQIENFKKGFPFIKLIDTATIENGIRKLNKEELKHYSEIYKKKSIDYDVLKFVPASGAASRMFKELLVFKENIENNPAMEIPENIKLFFHNIRKFAFFNELNNYGDIDYLVSIGKYDTVLSYLLDENYMNYKSLPKALIKFHKYEGYSRKAFEEHLVEAANYCKGKTEEINIHFTVPENFYDKYIQEVNQVKALYEERFGVKYNIGYSIQKHSTDTIAVELNNNPFRDKNGNLIFRPAGHGSLIANLNDCQNDVIFIKNIDNVAPDRIKHHTFLYKQALGGFMITLLEKLNQYLEILESNKVDKEMLIEIEEFTEKELNLKIDNYYKSYTNTNKINYLYYLLNKPVRICGMVRNTGEPGGGPFWIMDNSGSVTLQIIESSQVDLDNKEQAKIFKHSTHFNPVDIVCHIKDYKGNKFNLNEFIDKSTGFISVKSYDGRELKAQELPGLWNGGMAEWISVFVEVPLQTFTPVKTINDLLKPEHQEEVEKNHNSNSK